MSELLTRDVLIVNQKPKLIELTNEYKILDEQGAEIGVIRQEGQSVARKALRLFTSVDQFLTHRLSVYDSSGQKVVEIVRPAKIFKSTLGVLDGSGARVGQIAQRNVIGKKHFDLVATDGRPIGSIDAENWRGWDFGIHDAQGKEVGRITKKWAGVLKEVFTTADHYALEITGEVTPELRLLMLASAAGVDLALKQDDTGGAGFGGLDLDV